MKTALITLTDKKLIFSKDSFSTNTYLSYTLLENLTIYAKEPPPSSPQPNIKSNKDSKTNLHSKPSNNLNSIHQTNQENQNSSNLKQQQYNQQFRQRSKWEDIHHNRLLLIHDGDIYTSLIIKMKTPQERNIWLSEILRRKRAIINNIPKILKKLSLSNFKEEILHDIIVSRNLSFASALLSNFDTRRKKGGLGSNDDFARSLVYLFHSKNKGIRLVRWMIHKECRNGKNTSRTLYRSSSISSKILPIYGLLIGKQFLIHTLSPAIETISKINVLLDVDPERVGEQQAAKNREALKVLSNEFIGKIIFSIRDIPLPIRIIARAMHKAARRVFPESSCSSINNFIFLRFLVPVIASPENYGILDKEQLKNIQFRRNLVQISKIVQNVGNQSDGMLGTMSSLNDFIRSSSVRIIRFYKILTDLTTINEQEEQTLDMENYPLKESQIQESLQIMKTHILDNIDDIKDQMLHSDSRHEYIPFIIDFLENLIEDEDDEEFDSFSDDEEKIQSWIENNCKRKKIMDNFQESLEIIKNNLDNTELINNPIIVINNYALDEQNANEILNSGALDLLVQVVETHTTNQQILEKVVGALINCAYYDRAQRYLVHQLQTFDVLINLLQTHKTERLLALKCLSALWQLTLHKDNFQAIAEQEVVTEIIGQMRVWPNDSKIQSVALGALTGLSTTEKFGQSIVSVGGLLLVVQALEKFPNEDKLIKRAIMTLFNLAANPFNSTLVSQSDAVEVLMKMLVTNDDDEGLAQKCIRFFYNLSTNQDNSEHLGRVGLISNILYTMVKWKGYEKIVETSLGLLYNLATCVPNRTILAKENGAKAIVVAMRANRQFQEIQRKSLAIFTALVLEEHLISHLIDGKAIMASLLALRSYPTAKPIFRASLVLLTNCLFFDQSRSEVVNNNGVIVVLGEIDNFINDQEMAERVSLFILNATVDPTARKQIAHNNGKNICQKLEQKYSTNQLIVKESKAPSII